MESVTMNEVVIDLAPDELLLFNPRIEWAAQ
jgi:hypothetical protein